MLSHSWVDKGMPDTEDGKFYCAFLTLALNIYINTGIEYFWIDYLCVTQNPSKKELKSRQLEQIPFIISSSSFYISMCLEIYQYHSSAWCALETITFLGQNKYCRPLDFIEHTTRRNYHFGMNINDPSKVNANEKIIYSFTDSGLTCGSIEDIDFLNTQIPTALLHAKIRIWRLVCREIKSAINMDKIDPIGLFITEPIREYLNSDIFGENHKSKDQVFKNIFANVVPLGYKKPPESKVEALKLLLTKVKELFDVLNLIGLPRPKDKMVILRKEGGYDLDTSKLTTTYAFHNQNI